MPLPKGAQVVQQALEAAGSDSHVLEFPQGTRTVAEAAASIGVDEGQIAKSLVFISGDLPLLIVASGRYRVDLRKVKAITGQSVRQAKPDEVEAVTGFPIGGVAPLGHNQSLTILLDKHLWDYPVVYAAAGTPHTAFATTGDELVNLTGGTIVDVASDL